MSLIFHLSDSPCEYTKKALPKFVGTPDFRKSSNCSFFGKVCFWLRIWLLIFKQKAGSDILFSVPCCCVHRCPMWFLRTNVQEFQKVLCCRFHFQCIVLQSYAAENERSPAEDYILLKYFWIAAVHSVAQSVSYCLSENKAGLKRTIFVKKEWSDPEAVSFG